MALYFIATAHARGSFAFIISENIKNIPHYPSSLWLLLNKIYRHML